MSNQPGPMGWGLSNYTSQQRHSEEKRAFDALAAVVPKRLMRQPAKRVINQTLLTQVQNDIKAAGFDGGFSFRFLYKAIMKNPPPWLAQLIGSCVASGDFRTTVYRMMAECFLLNDPEQLPGSEAAGTESFAFFAPFNYRAGRREAGINGNSDGSLCLPHIRGKMKFGHLPCNTPGLRSDTFPEPQNQRLYKEWGANNRLMDQYLEQAGKFKLLESEPVKDPESSHELICEHFKPHNICSMWGFRSSQRMDVRGPDGANLYQWTRGREPWAHNMSVVGCLEYRGNRYYDIENSWSKFHNGNQDFLVEENEYGRWLRDAECQSVGEMDMADNAPAFPE